MSYIFEALQRAETERAGGSAPKPVESVVDLLEAGNGGRAGAGEVEGSPQSADQKAISAILPDIIAMATAAAAPPAEAPAAATTGVRPPVISPPVASPSVVSTPASSSPAIPPAAGMQLVSSSNPMSARSAYSKPEPAPSAAGFKGEGFLNAKVLTPATKANSRLVCLTDQGGLPAEKFRMLGLKLRHLREQRKLRRIVVTGTAPEEGKSLVAANLALNQSRSKVLKTLLIDGDLRRPTVAGRFGFDSTLPGLSECLRGERELSEVVYKLHNCGLYLLPAGRAPENPVELMQGGRLPELLEKLGEFFDWIIIDTPPVVPVADTTFWMKLADGVLVVVREGVSQKRVLERALEAFDPAVMLGVVVNSCSSSDHNDYYSRYGQAGGARDAIGRVEN